MQREFSMREDTITPAEAQPDLPDCTVSVSNIERASGLIEPVFRNSPQFAPEALGRRLGCRLLVKVETLNPIRSFKARGAQVLVSQLPGQPDLICATAGNFGQGMAYAARARGLRLTVFACANANVLKIERMRDFGADVRQVEGNFDAVRSAVRTFATETGALLIEDGREPAITEGAGTIGLELLQWKEPLDAVVVPLGDGALLGGIAACFKARYPTTRMIGVCAAGAPAMERSWRLRQVVSCSPTTIADGIGIQTPFAESVALLGRLIDDVLLVDDPTLIEAMRLAHRELGIVLEPAGAAGLAALLAHSAYFRGGRIATILTGGNPTDEQRERIMNSA
jgi:threonine dehydratase